MEGFGHYKLYVIWECPSIYKRVDIMCRILGADVQRAGNSTKTKIINITFWIWVGIFKL